MVGWVGITCPESSMQPSSPPLMLPAEVLRRCWFLAGPTASGKSAVALLLAERLGAEIVALDSMTLYREMDIGTAKPTATERALVPHHLFDILDPSADFSVAEYIRAAAEVVDDILSRGRVPLFVGGTGLYLRSLLRGVFAGPPANADLRCELEAVLQVQGPAALHERLRGVDPVTAARLPVNDTRRIIRALEVQTLTGQPLSEQHQQTPRPLDERPEHVYWLEPQRPWLHARINQRVVQMVDAGLVEEVTRLQTRQPPIGPTARQGLAYKEVLDWLDQPETEFSAVVELIQTRTRQFAKRQHTWFRNLVECGAITIAPEEPAATIAEKLLSHTTKTASR